MLYRITLILVLSRAIQVLSLDTSVNINEYLNTYLTNTAAEPDHDHGRLLPGAQPQMLDDLVAQVLEPVFAQRADKLVASRPII